MASLRKRYQSNGADQDGQPVQTAPVAGAELPPPVADKQPAEQPVENAVEQAAQNALKARLAEMENAEGLQREVLSQQQRMAAEEPLAIGPQEPQQQPQTVEEVIAASGLPERAQRWLLAHPDYVRDAQKNAHIQGLHYAAAHQAGGDAFSDLYFSKLEDLLGLKQATNGNGVQQPVRPAVPRQAAPVRQYVGPPVSAPPTRESPSMTTGRPFTKRAPLTAAQREAARYSGVSDDEYSKQVELMERMKAAGMHQDG